MSGTAETVPIADGAARAEVVPALGGGLARLDARDGEGWRAILRPWSGEPAPLGLAMNVLLPWSNRMSRGGFEWDGARWDVPSNLEGEPCPLHGDAWQRSWSVLRRDEAEVALALDGGTGPYRYEAELAYAIEAGALRATLRVVNRAGRALPYGAGFHPWFPRAPGTRLKAPAAAMWREGPGHLPLDPAPVPLGGRDAPRFDEPAPLPKGWINAGFEGWSGRARLLWPDGRAVRIEASRELGRYVLYSPSGDAPFVCFEPVSHAIDAFHLDGGPERHGMRVLGDGAGWEVGCRLIPERAEEVGDGA